MWPLPDADLYAEVVTSPNGLQITADVYQAGVKLNTYPIPIEEGSVTVDAGMATRRTCDLVVPPFLSTGRYSSRPSLPETPTAPLGHYGQELRILHSLVMPNGALLTVPVGRFRIDGAVGSELGRTAVAVTGSSREAFVVDDQFSAPRTVSGPSAVTLIRTLITESLPQAQVASTVSSDHGVAAVTEERDRWGLIQVLAASIGAVVYADPTGRFVIADAPTTSTAPVWRFAPAEGQTLLDARRTSSRAGVYNSVTVVGSTLSGETTPVTFTARDIDPTSPTRYGDPDDGAFGKVSKTIFQPDLTSTAQCAVMARAELTRYIGAASTLNLSGIPHAGLEALDVVDVVIPEQVTGFPTAVRRHAIDSFTLPLTPAGAFPVATRDLLEVAV